MDAAAEDEGSEGVADGVLGVEPGEEGVAGGEDAGAVPMFGRHVLGAHGHADEDKVLQSDL